MPAVGCVNQWRCCLAVLFFVFFVALWATALVAALLGKTGVVLENIARVLPLLASVAIIRLIYFIIVKFIERKTSDHKPRGINLQHLPYLTPFNAYDMQGRTSARAAAGYSEELDDDAESNLDWMLLHLQQYQPATAETSFSLPTDGSYMHVGVEFIVNGITDVMVHRPPTPATESPVCRSETSLASSDVVMEESYL